MRTYLPALVSLLSFLPNIVSARALTAAHPTQEENFQGIPFGDDEYAYTKPFFPGARYDQSVPKADSLLGGLQGSRLAHHEEILRCYRAWAAASPRITVQPYGVTHEGRELIYAVVTSPENHARLDLILEQLNKLHDPRGVSENELQRIVRESPASAWLGYSIHGDELSGADASLAVGYHLTACTDEDIEELLKRVVIVIDPVMNPDGRERIVSMTEQAASLTPNLDYAGMTRGRWPFGRGNHYLFDMNRDWMAGTQPETRGRWKTARRFHPQLFVDAHEMWSLDTFLFYPQNRPLNPELPPKLVPWQRRYAEDAAAAFDRYGWSYYTREWADAWAPFYSDSWGSLLGATGMLYEQARTLGTPLRRASGEILTYRESVHHQAVASLANVKTLAIRREEALRDYLANQKRNVGRETEGNDRMLVVPPSGNLDRQREVKRILLGQGIEATIAKQAFEGSNIETHLGEKKPSQRFPAGSLIVQSRQPLRPMVRAYFGFDVRMPLEDLQREREDLERKGSSRIYDLTSWSLPHALDIESYWCDAASVDGEALTPSAPGSPRSIGPTAGGDPVAWIVSGADDASVSFAARAMEAGLAVNISDRPFRTGSAESQQVPRGSLMIRRAENPLALDELERRIMKAAANAQVPSVYRIGTGLAPDDGPDLGGGHFQLLARPRVALLGNSPVAADTYGHLWHHLDRRVGLPFTLLDAQSFSGADLRRYNVLILPPAGGALAGLLEANKDRIENWIRSGGSLIACGNAAALITSERVGLSSVTLRRHALEDLSPYRLKAKREWDSREVKVDEKLIWEYERKKEGEEESDEADPYATEEVPEERDAWLRRFSPNGVTLRGRSDSDSWLTYGFGSELPVFFTGSSAFLSKGGVRTAVRFEKEERLRLNGLVWPEARERIAESAWLTHEGMGNGQIILFASTPAFRGYHLATARFLANAVVYGPGLGASQPLDW